MQTIRVVVGLMILAAVIGGLVVATGAYNVAATSPHLRPTFWVLETAMRRSVAERARDIEPPPLGDPAQIARGFELYQRHCVQCHGAPGVAPEPFALGMMPLPVSLVHTGRVWPARDIYWAIKHGIKMTGMPGWEYRFTESDLWAVVAFVVHLPTLTPRQYAELQEPPSREPVEPLRLPDADRGLIALHHYGCPTCHEIPGVVESTSPVGPSLRGVGSRAVIAGKLPNTDRNLISWIQHPQQINPDSAMPDLGVAEAHARDMAAYLRRLR